MGSSEDLDIQRGRPLADHSPHVSHDRVVKASVNFVDEKDTSLGIGDGESQSKQSPHSVAGTSDRNTVINPSQLDKYAAWPSSGVRSWLDSDGSNAFNSLVDYA